MEFSPWTQVRLTNPRRKTGQLACQVKKAGQKSTVQKEGLCFIFRAEKTWAEECLPEE